MYAALRDSDPVHHVVPPDTPDLDYYVLSRHADVWRAARDHETFSSAHGLTVNYGELELIGLADNPPFVMQDPPVHTEFRKLVSRGFTPRQVEAVEPAVRAFVVERIETLRANGGGDIVRELFKPLPSMVVAHYLGVPEADRAQFDGWTEAIVAANTESGGVAAAGDAIGAMAGYFAELIERRRREPADDTISHLVAAGVDVLPVLAFTFTMVTGVTTPPPECSAAQCNCCISAPTSGGCSWRSPHSSATPSTNSCGSPHRCRAGPHRDPRRDHR